MEGEDEGIDVKASAQDYWTTNTAREGKLTRREREILLSRKQSKITGLVT